MNKEHIETAASLLDIAAGTAEERNISNAFARGAKQLREAIAQLGKAPEPVAEVEELNQGFNDELLHVKWNVKPLIGMKLYTSPPEVAELQKQVKDLITQNTDYLERLRDVRGHYEAASKANEQAHVALAESQHKVTDLEKQVQALQAEVERLNENVKFWESKS